MNEHIEYETKGLSISADLWGIDFVLLDNLDFLLDSSKEAIKRANATFVSVDYKKFSPFGVTILILLEESSYGIHTYPSKSFASIDIYTCGDKAKPQAAIDYMIEQLRPDPSRVYMKRTIRGVE